MKQDPILVGGGGGGGDVKQSDTSGEFSFCLFLGQEWGV